MRSRRPTGWQFTDAATIAREVTARLFAPLFRFVLRGPAVQGANNLDDIVRPIIIAPTHASHVDFSAVRLALGPRHRRRLAPAAAADYFHASPIRWFFAAWLGAFAFDRSGTAHRDSFDAAEDLLAAGWHVLIFPEGTRSRSGELGPFKPGVGLLACRTNAPVLPVRLRGTWNVLPPGAHLPRRAAVSVVFGRPITPHPGESPRDFTARLEAAVRAL